MDQPRRIYYSENDAHRTEDERFFVFSQTRPQQLSPGLRFSFCESGQRVLICLSRAMGPVSFAKLDSCVMAGYTTECRSANYGRVARGALRVYVTGMWMGAWEDAEPCHLCLSLDCGHRGHGVKYMGNICRSPLIQAQWGNDCWDDFISVKYRRWKNTSTVMVAATLGSMLQKLGRAVDPSHSPSQCFRLSSSIHAANLQ